MAWNWPLFGLLMKRTLPCGQGSFGFKRKYDTHTGVDLYCEEDHMVVAVEDGEVVAVEHFTGYNESPWWEDTEAVLIEGESGVVLYGEIIPSVKVGDKLHQGDLVGKVKRVLKKDKGLPTTMLHLELYLPGTRKSEWWRENKPENLLDPTEHLQKAIEKEHELDMSL